MAASKKKLGPSTGRTKPWERTILGSPQSKANSRKLVIVKGKPMFIKSNAARSYLEDFLRQCPTLDPLFEDDITLTIDIYYSSRRPDLDESLIMDAMQGKIYGNDRQVRKKIVEGFVDKENPRAVIRVELYTPPEEPI